MTKPVWTRASRGFLFAVLAGLVFQCLNASVKLLVVELPPLQVALLRWITGIAWIAPFALAYGFGGLRTQDLRLHGLRSLFHASGYGLWYSALGSITLATTAALAFTAPLFVTLGAVLFLGEKVRRARWIAVFVGFLGVLVILRPGFTEIGVATLVMLASVPLIAGSNLVAKVVAGRDTPAQVVFWQSVFAMAWFTPFGIWLWQPVSTEQWLLAAFAGLAGTVAYFFLIWAYRLLDISAVQPLMFLGIVWASLADVVLFGSTADPWTFVGAAVVVASSTMLVGRESRLEKSAR
ncbi:MAG: DMT family transporter [Betaproteobacteria bacterium]|nr:DMT family transporter [Betaproteobacteria bacterium]